MQKSKYAVPEHRLPAFNCPSCHVYAKQHWFYLSGVHHSNVLGPQQVELQFGGLRFEIARCESCSRPSMWFNYGLIYPVEPMVEHANDDLPPDIRADYDEARNIASSSPRGAAALLRLAIQKLCQHLGQPGKNINEDIKNLVALGLPPSVQQAFDSVRVIGNDAVHPGSIDLRDDPATVAKLFRLVNFIVQKTITEPREIDDIYRGLPADKLRGIDQRDTKK
jgi:hypothetical protein